MCIMLNLCIWLTRRLSSTPNSITFIWILTITYLQGWQNQNRFACIGNLTSLKIDSGSTSVRKPWNVNINCVVALIFKSVLTSWLVLHKKNHVISHYNKYIILTHYNVSFVISILGFKFIGYAIIVYYIRIFFNNTLYYMLCHIH